MLRYLVATPEYHPVYPEFALDHEVIKPDIVGLSNSAGGPGRPDSQLEHGLCGVRSTE
jgi:hypothetical protein